MKSFPTLQRRTTEIPDIPELQQGLRSLTLDDKSHDSLTIVPWKIQRPPCRCRPHHTLECETRVLWILWLPKLGQWARWTQSSMSRLLHSAVTAHGLGNFAWTLRPRARRPLGDRATKFSRDLVPHTVTGEPNFA